MHKWFVRHSKGHLRAGMGGEQRQWDDLGLGLEEWSEVCQALVLGTAGWCKCNYEWSLFASWLSHCEYRGHSLTTTSRACTTSEHFEYRRGNPKFSHLWEDEFMSVTRCIHHAWSVGQRSPDACLFVNKVLLECSYAQSFYVCLWQLLPCNGGIAVWPWPLLLSIMITSCVWDLEIWTWLCSLNYRKQQYGCY